MQVEEQCVDCKFFVKLLYWMLWAWSMMHLPIKRGWHCSGGPTMPSLFAKQHLVNVLSLAAVANPSG